MSVAIASATSASVMQHPVIGAVVLASLMQLSAFGHCGAIFHRVGLSQCRWVGGVMIGVMIGAMIVFAFSIAIAMPFAIACSSVWL